MPTLYSATMSLDGYIAGPGGDMSWFGSLDESPSDGSNATAERLAEQVGCLLVGGRTHRGDDPNAGTDKEGAFGGQYDGPAVVLSRRGPHGAAAGTEFYSEVHAAVARATELAGERYVNILGAEAARSCLDAGLLDEVLLFVAPVMLGAGVRVLDRPGHPPVLLDRLHGATEHWYRVRRS